MSHHVWPLELGRRFNRVITAPQSPVDESRFRVSKLDVDERREATSRERPLSSAHVVGVRKDILEQSDGGTRGVVMIRRFPQVVVAITSLVRPPPNPAVATTIAKELIKLLLTEGNINIMD